MSRDIKVYLRLSADERAALQRAAETEGVSLSEYIRRILFLGVAVAAQPRREVDS